MTVIVTGGRNYKNDRLVNKVLSSLNNVVTVVQGGANGADFLARQWARGAGVACLTFDADWEGDGKAAGPIRNGVMLKANPTAIVVAFPGGKGTEDCVRQAKSRGHVVLRVEE